ncbi:MAG: hypothetical protein DWQ10_03515 [Calditrichaeota bacterium]|nr:MAG: hypothetical protein DWQ10_03515 [Calditrichota bacterium]
MSIRFQNWFVRTRSGSPLKIGRTWLKKSRKNFTNDNRRKIDRMISSVPEKLIIPSAIYVLDKNKFFQSQLLKTRWWINKNYMKKLSFLITKRIGNTNSQRIMGTNIRVFWIKKQFFSLQVI